MSQMSFRINLYISYFNHYIYSLLRNQYNSLTSPLSNHYFVFPVSFHNVWVSPLNKLPEDRFHLSLILPIKISIHLVQMSESFLFGQKNQKTSNEEHLSLHYPCLGENQLHNQNLLSTSIISFVSTQILLVPPIFQALISNVVGTLFPNK